jgi:hypothetical protein
MDNLRPKRRVVIPSNTAEAIDKLDTPPNKPKTAQGKPLSELARIERQLYLADLGLNYYQDKLERGISLDPEEQRLFLAHQDSMRKLEMSRAALTAKATLGGLSNLEVAKGMMAKGMKRDHVLLYFPADKEVLEGL